MIRPEHITDFWAKSRHKEAILEHLTNYYKPKSSYDPERVDYNAANILAEFQVFNLEFCKNELALSDI